MTSQSEIQEAFWTVGLDNRLRWVDLTSINYKGHDSHPRMAP